VFTGKAGANGETVRIVESAIGGPARGGVDGYTKRPALVLSAPQK
jgi:hypothetical protein